MPKRATLTTQEYLVNAALPEATETYTVISHGAVIAKTKELLAAKGFEIERELYRCNEGAQVAQGVYHLKYGNDPDMSMLFAWSNSYDKSMKFKCSVGGYVHASLAALIGSNMASWGRKHTGTADEDTFGMIESQIENAEEYFRQLVADKEAMKLIPVTEQERAELMGRLYFVHELLTGEQLGLVRDQFNKPSFTYSGIQDSLWSMYNGIIYSLQKAHPRTWMDQQRMTHWFLCEHFKITAGNLAGTEQNRVNGEEPLTDPRQLNLIDAIEEAEQDKQPAESFDWPKETSVGGGEVFAETADQTIVVERTEPELNHELHGVNNDNVEATLRVSPEVMQEEKKEEDMSWPCLGCGQMQGPDDIFHDGQLCTSCNSKS